VNPLSDIRNSRVSDLWIALLAGERVWHDGPIQPTPRDRIAAAFALCATACTVTLIWVTISTRFDPWNFDVINSRRAALLVMATAATIAALALAARYQRIVRGHEAVGRPFWIELVWRAAAFLVLVVVFAGALPRAHVVGVVPLGVLAGADASLTLRVLGVVPRARTWVRRFLISPVHFGALGALLAVATFGDSLPALRTVISVYLAMWVGLIVAALTAVIINRLGIAVDEGIAEESHDVLVSERARRAHWLHDDVLSEVHLASLRISSGSATPDQVNAELRDLDHRLRLRQLDDMMSAGRPRIYEILQPHLRRAQSLGLRLESVPSHEVTRLEVDQQCAELLNRAVSLLTSNAINAGATQLTIDLEVLDGGARLVLRITDDAGGFDLAAVPDGRGLHTLIQELGADGVQRHDVPGGSLMAVVVPRSLADSERHVDHHDQHPDRGTRRRRHGRPGRQQSREITS
jgi:signal transduction histidine kinase